MPTLAVVRFSLFCIVACGCVAAQQPVAPASVPPAPPAAPNRFQAPEQLNFDDHEGFTRIFDGKTLKEWEGDPAIWRVEDGAMIGESTSTTVRPPNTYISYHGVEAHDFDLKLEVKVERGGGTGIQYRGTTGGPWIFARPGQAVAKPQWLMTGPQADFWFPVDPQHESYSGQFYSENTPMGILAFRGQVTQSEPGKVKRLVGNINAREALGGYVKTNGWNQYEIIARGSVMIHIINGQLMAVYIDDDPKSSNNISGLIGIELEGTPTKISVRNIWLRKVN